MWVPLGETFATVGALAGVAAFFNADAGCFRAVASGALAAFAIVVRFAEAAILHRAVGDVVTPRGRRGSSGRFGGSARDAEKRKSGDCAKGVMKHAVNLVGIGALSKEGRAPRGVLEIVCLTKTAEISHFHKRVQIAWQNARFPTRSRL